MAPRFARIFTKGAEIFAWYLGVAIGTFTLVIGLTTFASSHSSSDASSHSSSDAPAPTQTCNTDSLYGKISIYTRMMVCFMIIALLLMAFVRKIVEAAAKDHERDAAMEDANYTAAIQDHRTATIAVTTAEVRVQRINSEHRINLASGDVVEPVERVEQVDRPSMTLADARDDLEKCVIECRQALAKAQRAMPEEGIARIKGRLRIVVRGAFFLAVAFSYVGSIFAALGFYFSLELQVKCVNGFTEISPFVAVGVVATLVHFVFGWVSLCQN